MIIITNNINIGTKIKLCNNKKPPITLFNKKY